MCNRTTQRTTPSRSPFPIFLDTLPDSERGDLADQRQRERLLEWKPDRRIGRDESLQILREGSDCRWRWIEADVMFEHGKSDQYPPIGKRGHSPLQAFFRSGSRCSNTRSHFTQFLLRLFGRGIDIFGDALRWLFWKSSLYLAIQTQAPGNPPIHSWMFLSSVARRQRAPFTRSAHSKGRRSRC